MGLTIKLGKYCLDVVKCVSGCASYGRLDVENKIDFIRIVVLKQERIYVKEITIFSTRSFT